jgi:pimeloyl-ACP methyl ester carboxylesterase
MDKKKHIILLHGALGSTDYLEPLAERLSAHYNVQNHLFPGHGGRLMHDKYSIATFANDVLQRIQNGRLEKPLVFGYSMGGYVALYLEQQYPGTFAAITTFATKFNWTPDTASKEAAMLDADQLQAKHPEYVDMLAQRHAPLNWQDVLNSTAGMMRDMGMIPPLDRDILHTIECPVWLSVGDKDRMVSIEETSAIQRAIPGAQLAVLPNTGHPMEKLDLNLMEFLLRRFLC